MSILRKCLRATDGPDDYLLRTGASLQLNPELPHWHDLTGLHKELEALRQEERAETAMGHARRALQLYRGPYLEDCYLDWALDIRNQTELRVLEAARLLAGLAVGAQAWLEVLEAARRILDLDPLDQDAYLMLMQANTSLGRAEEAARQYEACRKMLKNELGMEPGLDLMREHQRALIALSVPPS